MRFPLIQYWMWIWSTASIPRNAFLKYKDFYERLLCGKRGGVQTSDYEETLVISQDNICTNSWNCCQMSALYSGSSPAISYQLDLKRMMSEDFPLAPRLSAACYWSNCCKEIIERGIGNQFIIAADREEGLWAGDCSLATSMRDEAPGSGRDVTPDKKWRREISIAAGREWGAF